MSFEPVDFYLVDKSPAANPVEGVLVKIYDRTGAVFFTQGIADSAGHVGLLLETQEYSARFFKAHVAIDQPQLLDVFAAPIANSFTIQADVLTAPIATDPRLCRASGFFRELTGGPRRWLDIFFIARFAPIMLDGDAIFTERVSIRTDDQGFAVIDLIRGGCYDAYVEGNEDSPRYIAVPDSASVNLPDLLLPVVASITFDPPGPYNLTVGQDLAITPTVVTSDGRPLDGAANQDVRWASSDPTIMGVSPAAKTINLRGAAAGTANIVATRLDCSIIRIPNTPIAGQPVAVTVT